MKGAYRGFVAPGLQKADIDDYIVWVCLSTTAFQNVYWESAKRNAACKGNHDVVVKMKEVYKLAIHQQLRINIGWQIFRR